MNSVKPNLSKIPRHRPERNNEIQEYLDNFKTQE